MPVTLLGKFKKIIYSSQGFYVVNFKLDSNQNEQKNLLNISENLNSINVILKDKDFDFKVTYEIMIEVKESRKYGQSFYVTNKTIVVKQDSQSLVEYLSSSLFKGISVVTAKKLIENLPLNFIDNPKEYHQQIVDLIGKNKAQSLISTLDQVGMYQKFYREFIKHDLSVSLPQK